MDGCECLAQLQTVKKVQPLIERRSGPTRIRIPATRLPDHFTRHEAATLADLNRAVT